MHAEAALNLRQSRTLAMTAQLRRAIGLLRYSNLELAEYVAREVSQNPFLEVRMPAARGSGTTAGRSVRGGGGGPADNSWERLPGPPAGLHEHVARQISLNFRDPKQRRIAVAFMEALEPSGWLGMTVEEVACGSGCRLEEAEAVLARLQECEPAGLFARSLAECLRLQAREAGVLDEAFDALLGRLDLLAVGDLAGLAEVCRCGPERIAAHARTIRSFDPKPGAAFGFDSQPPRPPDIIVSRGALGWAVELNASTLPEVTVRDDMLRDRDRRDAFVAEALATARGMRRAVEQRNASTLAVASEIVRRQSPFVEASSAPLVPLSLRDVAEAVSMHESTVSRITVGLTIAAPRGVMELRTLLCRGLPGPEAPVSVPSVQGRIRSLIAAERAAAPLSDECIAKLLKAEGLGIERRTVAKYRSQMRIPSSSQRRRQANSILS